MTESNETGAQSRSNAKDAEEASSALRTSPDTEGQRAWPIRALTVLLIVGMMVVGVMTAWRMVGDHHVTSKASASPRPTPTTRPPARAVLNAAGLVAALPDVLAIIRPELSPQIRMGRLWYGNIAGEPLSNSQLYTWTSFNARYGRYLRVSVARSPDPGSAHTDLKGRRKVKADQHISAAGHQIDSGSAKPLSGVGQEAFSIPEIERGSVQPDVDRPDRRYDVGGGYFCVRFRNVVIAVDVMGADYPPDAAKNNVLHGRDTSYQQSQREALPLIKAIIGHLS